MIPGLALTGRNSKTPAEGAEPLQPVPLEPIEHFVDDTRGLLGEFVDALENGTPLATSGQDHIKTMGLFFACIEAAKSDRWIKMQDFYEMWEIPERWL